MAQQSYFWEFILPQSLHVCEMTHVQDIHGNIAFSYKTWKQPKHSSVED